MKKDLTYDETTSNEEYGQCLKCPVCSGNNVHFENPEMAHSGDAYGVAWKGRGDAIRIPLWCENGHSWILRFGFHKGYTFLKIEPKENKCKYCDRTVSQINCDGSLLNFCAYCGAKYLR